ncbi:MAG: GTP cyclohydrolase [Schleiferiaceae bacterium]|nr:GTP cyclohydrolase [Schleiferiaceae bacterium]
MKKSFSLVLLFCATLLLSCEKDTIAAPEPENEVEEFTYIEFIFTNENDPADVAKGIWEDPDGFGPQEPSILQQPQLKPNTTYLLTFVFENRLLSPVYNLMPEILDEADEHQVFFAFDEALFTSPTGTGNIADRNGAINYEDVDENVLPVGLQTLWTTAGPQQDRNFRAVLAHQPGVKSATSSWDSGDIDWDITFSVTIAE